MANGSHWREARPLSTTKTQKLLITILNRPMPASTMRLFQASSSQLAPYNLEAFKKAGVEIDEFEEGRERALVGIFKSRYLKRFESSIEAFRISVRRALAFLRTFESYILDGRLIKAPTSTRFCASSLLKMKKMTRRQFLWLKKSMPTMRPARSSKPGDYRPNEL